MKRIYFPPSRLLWVSQTPDAWDKYSLVIAPDFATHEEEWTQINSDINGHTEYLENPTRFELEDFLRDLGPWAETHELEPSDRSLRFTSKKPFIVSQQIGENVEVVADLCSFLSDNNEDVVYLRFQGVM